MLKGQPMDKELINKYAPWLLVVILFILQYNIFVTPAQLEMTHRIIIKEVTETFTTKEQYNDLKEQLTDMQNKIDKIYEKVIK